MSSDGENRSGRRYVALAHGIWDTAKIFRKLRQTLEAEGYACIEIDFQPSSGANGLEKLAEQLRDAIDSGARDAASIDLIGFSMGGLVGRYYLQRLGGLEKVRRFLTISSPHGGSWTCFFPLGKGVRQMRPGSRFLVDLDQDLERLKAVEFTSFYTPFDLMVIPAGSSKTSVSRNVSFPAAWHSWMLVEPRVHESVLDFLARGLK